ncbi:HAD hydrolase family protein, partial [Salmonella enterica subsp. enterica serovar Lubbock]|nr:HAD hydrolase family protein [Salmonella enterica subsp. enterica serovar Lubbock]
ILDTMFTVVLSPAVRPRRDRSKQEKICSHDRFFSTPGHGTSCYVDCLEVLPLGCNKGSALAVLSNHLGLSLADCMAFGDAMNDRE